MNEVERGKEAQGIIESEVYKKAMQTLADGYQSQWINSRPDEVAERERAYTKIQILADFVNEVKTVMETGKMVEHEEEANKYRNIGTHY